MGGLADGTGGTGGSGGDEARPGGAGQFGGVNGLDGGIGGGSGGPYADFGWGGGGGGAGFGDRMEFLRGGNGGFTQQTPVGSALDYGGGIARGASFYSRPGRCVVILVA